VENPIPERPPSLQEIKDKLAEISELSGDSHKQNSEVDLMSTVHSEESNGENTLTRKKPHKSSLLIKPPEKSLNIQHKGSPKNARFLSGPGPIPIRARAIS
jgi:hypothetical protein